MPRRTDQRRRPARRRRARRAVGPIVDDGLEPAASGCSLVSAKISVRKNRRCSSPPSRSNPGKRGAHSSLKLSDGPTRKASNPPRRARSSWWAPPWRRPPRDQPGCGREWNERFVMTGERPTGEEHPGVHASAGWTSVSLPAPASNSASTPSGMVIGSSPWPNPKSATIGTPRSPRTSATTGSAGSQSAHDPRTTPAAPSNHPTGAGGSRTSRSGRPAR